MRIDYDYLKHMLNIMLDTTAPTISSRDFNLSTEEESKYIFHLRLLRDNKLIEGLNNEPDNIGIVEYWGGEEAGVNELSYRLTMAGHDFASNLNKPEVWDSMKTKLKDEGFSAVVDIAKELALSYAKNKFGLND